MLKLLAQLGLVIGSVGMLSSYLDPEVAKGAGEMLRKVSSLVKQSDVAGSTPAAEVTEKMADTISNASGNRSPSSEGNAKENAIAGRAFHNRLPDDCIGEKKIELEGVVTCNQGRRAQKAD